MKPNPKSKSKIMEPKPYFYLYGITRVVAASPGILAPGVDGTGVVEAIAVDDLMAWYSPVSSREFGSELPQWMEDLEWLAERGVRHQKVVAEIAARTAIVPARFGTVFILRRNLTKHVAAHASETGEALKRVQDAEEWGVKVLRRLSPKPPQAVAGPVTSGAAYLRKKSALQSQRESERESKRESEISPELVAFANELSKCAVAAAPVGKLSSAQRGLEWQATFLVKKDDKSKWESVLRNYAARWADAREIECTGPWPPYSFV
ncbi:MAG: GvpL/GvpF family gas vesicle protein [Acidobacteriaceae bacterium]